MKFWAKQLLSREMSWLRASAFVFTTAISSHWSVWLYVFLLLNFLCMIAESAYAHHVENLKAQQREEEWHDTTKSES